MSIGPLFADFSPVGEHLPMMETQDRDNTRAAKITDENRLESQRLNQLWQVRKRRSQAAFGSEIGLGQGAVSHLLTGRMAMTLDHAVAFANELGCEISNFSPRLAIEAAKVAQAVKPGGDSFIEVKRANAVLSAGPGAIPEVFEELGSLAFRRDFLKACGVTQESANVVSVRGTSMEPTIPDGAVLLINRKNTEPRNGAIFALAKADEGTVVKRLVKVSGQWFARSDNPDGNPDFAISDGQPVAIIGRVVWMGVKL